jgi:plastocyanin
MFTRFFIMSSQHMTTRRGFIGAFGFGGVALYGAWAAYGAAPLPFAGSIIAGNAAQPQADTPQAHSAHGGAGSMSPAEFLRRHEQFISRFRQPDGSVAVGVQETASADRSPSHAMAADHGTMAHPGAHSQPAPAQGGHGGHGGHAMPPMPEQADQHAGMTEPDAEPLDIYLHAFRFGFAPDELRLRAGQRYRFRMMASDISHGASLQLGHASRIIRLRANIVSEQTISFRRPGPVLVYCTVFCGPAHDAMKARILVA